MLKKVGYQDALISNDKGAIAEADKLILPGVGHFDYGMNQLRQSPFFDILNQRVLEDKIPILGICLGAQLLTLGSEEGSERGLGWINAQTVKFKIDQAQQSLKIPHMGWGEIAIQKESKLLLNMPPEPRFYFVHTYHLVCADQQDELASSSYGYEFTAAIERGNILGVQFHPEKSHKYGMALLRNFVENY